MSLAQKRRYTNGGKRPLGFTRRHTEEEKLKMKGRAPWNKGINIQTNTGRTHFKKDVVSCNKGGKTSVDKKKLSDSGKLGAAKRWANHIKIKIDKKNNIRHWSISHDPKIQLEKKRFRNQRYKASKINAEGSHTFEQWLVLKSKYMNMCLCCKRFEPEIKLTEDHIIPLKMDGSDNIENIQPLCQSCNSRKHIKVIDYREYERKGGENTQYLIN